ncbi:MAG TPA: serine hydrolase domain-containing protein [Acidobacteriaceae bacterium]|nr:serine hydrolase domain-containing protein [Acidobacteriaceae bacterium]
MSQFPAAHSFLIKAITEHAFPGAAYGVLLDEQVLAAEAVGRFTYDPNSPQVQPETIFDIASVTKVLATTAMAMSLWERGQLDLDQPVGERLPQFVADEPADSAKHSVTPRMLLAHSSGLPAYARLYEQHRTADALLSACLRMPLESAPDTRTVYSDIGFIILGPLLEAIADERLDRYCHRNIFTPLGMSSTLYRPPAEVSSAIPPTGIDNELRHRTLQGEVHDDNCYVLGGVSGHAGLFSNAGDILRFANCILNAGVPLFRPETVSLFTARNSNMPNARALGWDMPTRPSSSGQYFSPSSVGHLGYTGTSLWIDFEKRLAVVLLTNRTFPGKEREEVFNQIQQVRPRFHDAVIRELGLDFLIDSSDPMNWKK